MKQAGKQFQLTDLGPSAKPSAPEIVVSDISIDKLIDDCLVTLHREVKNLMMMSVRGKLDAAMARDLRDHLKLLFDLKDRENSMLRGLSDEDLQKIVEAPIESKQD